jgi:NAD(P)H-hydrate epimerase
MKFVTVEQMIRIEQEANASGLTYEEMMENAGRGLGAVIDSVYNQHRGGGVLGLVGSGNNGGDTLVALIYLAEHGWRISAYLVKPRPADNKLITRFIQSGGKVFSYSEDPDFRQLLLLLKENDIILDGVLGTGFRLPLKGDLANILGLVKIQIMGLAEAPIVVAVDCPSGVDCDSGECADEVIPAQLTVTMAAVKVGLLKLPAFRYCGKIKVVGIGLDEEMPSWKEIHRTILDDKWVKEKLPVRPDDGHKGTFGSVLIIAGCKNYIGAGYLSAKSAYLAGCGLVTVAAIDSVQKAMGAELPEATWVILPDHEGYIAKEAFDIIKEMIGNYGVILLGPGLGLENCTLEFIQRLIPYCGKQNVRMVIDADGLKLVAKLEKWPELLPAQTILTPHPGEMSYITNLPVTAIQADRVNVAEKYAQEWGHIVVLKGAFTIIASPDGNTMLSPVATSALAKAGSGDVLAGIISGLCAQRMPEFEASSAGVWIHARSGEMAAEQMGTNRSLLATDIIANIPRIFCALS